MAGKIQFIDCYAEGCGIGMSLPAEANGEILVDGFTASDCGIGILQRDPLSLAANIGLPLDTPPELIIEAAKALEGQNVSDIEKIGTLSSLPIWTYLKRATDVGKATTSLIGAAKAITAAFQSIS